MKRMFQVLMSRSQINKVTPRGLFWADNSNIYMSSPKINKIGTAIKAEDNFGWDTY